MYRSTIGVNPPIGDVRSDCTWLIGRGASIACGLSWAEPESWRSQERAWRIQAIKHHLREAMANASIDAYRELLSFLSSRTSKSWKHRFATTNWDTLLEMAIRELPGMYLPNWLNNSYVFHLNGSIDENPAGTPFLLETDPRGTREPTVEGNMFYNQLLMSSTVIVIGMSFECETDKSLMVAIQNAQNWHVVGEAPWIVVNPDTVVLDTVCSRLRFHLPRASVHSVREGFAEWLRNGLLHLRDLGILT